MSTKVCVFNQTSKLIDLIVGAETGPGVEGTPVVLNQDGVVDPTLLLLGAPAVAGEFLPGGSLVNLYSEVSGSPPLAVLKAQLAYADSTGTAPSGDVYPRQAVGFVTDPAFAPGDPVTVSFAGLFHYVDTHGEFSNADLGAEVYLSTVDKGGITKTRPSGAGQLDESVGYVLSFATGLVTVLFIGAFNDFSRISGVCQVNQGGTSATTGPTACLNLGAAYNTVLPKTLPDSDYTITLPESENGVFIFSGTLTSDAWTVSFPATARAIFTLVNATNHDLSFKATGGVASVVLAPGDLANVYCDGTNVLMASTPAVISSNNTGQTSSIPPTTLFTPFNTALYRISLYEEVTLAPGPPHFAPFGSGFYGMGVYAGPDALQTQLSWTDDAGARLLLPILTPLDATATNYDQADVVIRAAAGVPVRFQTILVNSGTPVYSVFVRAEKL